jgi:hypothetical protein
MCGCGGRKTSVGRRPVVKPRQRTGLTNGTSPLQLRRQQNDVSSLGVSKTGLSTSGLSKKRRELEKKRRAAVLRALGRP